MTQERDIAKWLMSGKAITPLQAIEKFGSLRLGARIYDIRQRCGEDSVKTIMVDTPTGKRIARYLGEPARLRRVYG